VTSAPPVGDTPSDLDRRAGCRWLSSRRP